MAKYQQTTMIDINSIALQVKVNCNISDAKYWGLYSPCGLLLRMRDLYKIEKGLKPWEKVEPDKMGEWIEKREKLWEALSTFDFQKIEINGKKYYPFNVKGINAVLVNHGFLYSAGYGNLLKPVFILAELSESSRKNKYGIYITGREIARDLSTSLAMLQGNKIIMRHETMNLFFWNKFEEMRAMKCSGSLFYAFSEYGISKGAFQELSPEELEKRFAKIAREEILTYIYHEIGEASQRKILGRWWKESLLELPYSRAELFIRGIKDVLSDTCTSGMLSYIIKNKKTASLYFYVALLSGFRKTIFPHILTAYEEFVKTRDWNLIERARVEGYRKVRGYVDILKEIYDKGRISPAAIEQEVMQGIV